MKLEVPYFRQFNNTACQPACFQMIAKYWGKNVSQKQLFKKTYVGPGTSTALCGIELMKKGFTFLNFFNLKAWQSRQSASEVKKYAQRHVKALKAGMIHKRRADPLVAKRYLQLGVPLINEVCCNSFYDDPQDKESHAILLVGYSNKTFYYHDSYPGKGGAFKRISEKKLKKTWTTLPHCVPNLCTIIPRIVITGTPCTGKSTVAELLGKRLGVPVTHAGQLARREGLISGKSKKTGSLIVDVVRLRKRLLRVRGAIEGHLLCEFSLPNAVVFVLRCDPRVLEKRMKQRKYSEQKIRANLECEALDYCTQLAEKNYGKKKVFDVNTTKRTPGRTVKKILQILKGKEKGDVVDFSEWLLK